MTVEPIGSPWAGLHKRTPGTVRRPPAEHAPIAVAGRDSQTNAPNRLAIPRPKPVAIPIVTADGRGIGTVDPDGRIAWRDVTAGPTRLSSGAERAAIARAVTAIDRGHARGVIDDDGRVRAIRVDIDTTYRP